MAHPSLPGGRRAWHLRPCVRIAPVFSAAAAQIAGLNGIPVRANVTADRSMLTGLLSEPVLLNVGALGLGTLVPRVHDHWCAAAQGRAIAR
ncbi:hypothetical protein NFA_2510 [Nocardia farcinica IFM 10152]|uniref:Uncharacterized protein n=1 Tax=Nocardia farcinica (strain IFM 10152) TaxID=247156 RepID=Q5Z398_NOCFA|nr:hypothetical protein NFA_2510 [Nocardia farcinica IFM 10152]